MTATALQSSAAPEAAALPHGTVRNYIGGALADGDGPLIDVYRPAACAR